MEVICRDSREHLHDSFGNVTNSTGTVSNSIRYTGREFDPEINLYFYRARYYDSKVGQFISEDPVGFGGGINFYNYVGGNPVNYRDPSGQWPVHGKWCGPNWTGGHWDQYDPTHDKKRLVQFRAHRGFQSGRIGGHIACFYNVWAGEREFAGANVWEGGDEP